MATKNFTHEMSFSELREHVKHAFGCDLVHRETARHSEATRYFVPVGELQGSSLDPKAIMLQPRKEKWSNYDNRFDLKDPKTRKELGMLYTNSNAEDPENQYTNHRVSKVEWKLDRKSWKVKGE